MHGHTVAFNAVGDAAPLNLILLAQHVLSAEHHVPGHHLPAGELALLKIPHRSQRPQPGNHLLAVVQRRAHASPHARTRRRAGAGILSPDARLTCIGHEGGLLAHDARAVRTVIGHYQLSPCPNAHEANPPSPAWLSAISSFSVSYSAFNCDSAAVSSYSLPSGAAHVARFRPSNISTCTASSAAPATVFPTAVKWLTSSSENTLCTPRAFQAVLALMIPENDTTPDGSTVAPVADHAVPPGDTYALAVVRLRKGMSNVAAVPSPARTVSNHAGKS